MKLSALDPAEIRQFGIQLLRTHRDTASCFEAAAQQIVRTLYQGILDDQDQPAFALVRVYRLTKYDGLSPELQALADATVPYWMALAATHGIEPEWNERQLSRGHKVVPAGDARSPMVAAAFKQIGLDEAPTTDGLSFSEATFMTRYFHVEEALGSPYIPAQADFVRIYGIRSVLGLGAKFASGNAHLTLCFSKASIGHQAAADLAVLSSHISTLLASFDTKKIWL